MRNLLLIAVLFCTVVSAAQAQSAYIKRQTVSTPEALEQADIYHESDDLIGKKDRYTVYLNTTSAERDTIYIITYKETVAAKKEATNPTTICTGTTKANKPCKNKTTHASGLCHHHR